MSTIAIGLDIGGANLKLADSNGIAKSQRFALWKEPQKLASILAEFVGSISKNTPIGVTMTGELCDCFRTKREGVHHIVAAAAKGMPNHELLFWSVCGKFMDATEAMMHPIDVAAANWHAQATFVAREQKTGLGLLIDMGSTTTDLIPFLDGRPIAQGLTDVSRLESQELIYQGTRRTPTFALQKHACAEFFATTNDVFVLLGELDENDQDFNTADGRSMTNAHAWERLARTIGGDRETLENKRVLNEAKAIRDLMRDRLGVAIRSIESRLETRFENVCISGSGEKLLSAFLTEIRPDLMQLSFSERFGREASEAACAFSVARLRSEGTE